MSDRSRPGFSIFRSLRGRQLPRRWPLAHRGYTGSAVISVELFSRGVAALLPRLTNCLRAHRSAGEVDHRGQPPNSMSRDRFAGVVADAACEGVAGVVGRCRSRADPLAVHALCAVLEGGAVLAAGPHDPRFRWIRRAGSCARTTAYGGERAQCLLLADGARWPRVGGCGPVTSAHGCLMTAASGGAAACRHSRASRPGSTCSWSSGLPSSRVWPGTGADR